MAFSLVASRDYFLVGVLWSSHRVAEHGLGARASVVVVARLSYLWPVVSAWTRDPRKLNS